MPDLCAGSFRCNALIEQLKQVKGCEIELITTMPNRYASFNSSAERFEKNDNLTVNRIELPPHKSGMLDQIKSFTYFYISVMKIAKNKDYDLIFATSSRLFTAFLGSRLAKKKCTPLYLDIRDIFVDTIKDVLPPFLASVSKPFLNIVERFTFENASHINLVSKGFEKYFKSKFNKPTYSWFTNGIDQEFLDFDKLEKRVTNNKVNIVYAGNVGEGQGLHNIIPSIASNLDKKYQITIIGDGGRYELLKQSVRGLENVMLYPPVKRCELVKKYLEADVLFLHLNDYPAFEKVLPSKLFEYAATGKPILAGVSGYAATFILDEIPNAEVFYPNNSFSAIEALYRLDMKDSLRREFIDKYQRSNIMAEMVHSIISVGERHE